MNAIHAIPTMYRGVQFRSRLEAKWAAFFDLCEWPWSYEPKDFHGWIPDFAIGELPTLVEIKPFFDGDEWQGTICEIAESGCQEPVILLGADPTLGGYVACDQAPAVGLLLLPGQEAELQPIHFGHTEGNNKLGLCPLDGGWVNYVWRVPAKRDKYPNHPNKWSRVWLCQDDVRRVLVANWSEACNRSQWSPP